MSVVTFYSMKKTLNLYFATSSFQYFSPFFLWLFQIFFFLCFNNSLSLSVPCPCRLNIFYLIVHTQIYSSNIVSTKLERWGRVELAFSVTSRLGVYFSNRSSCSNKCNVQFWWSGGGSVIPFHALHPCSRHPWSQAILTVNVCLNPSPSQWIIFRTNFMLFKWQT